MENPRKTIRPTLLIAGFVFLQMFWIGAEAETRQSVRHMQLELMRHCSGLPEDFADGLPGKATRAAVMRFQASYGLVQDGVAGPKTIAALQGPVTGACNESSDALPRPDAGEMFREPAQPLIDVAKRKAELSEIPTSERAGWCRPYDDGWPPPVEGSYLARKATITGEITKQDSNVQRAGNRLFVQIERYYAGKTDAAEAIREFLTHAIRIEAFTDIEPYIPPAENEDELDYSGYNPLNEPYFQVGVFMEPLSHAFLIAKEEFPHDEVFLSAVVRWGDKLFEVTSDGRDDFTGSVRGVDRRAMITAGWASWGNVTANREVLARAYEYYGEVLREIGTAGRDLIWHTQKRPNRIPNYTSMTNGAGLVAAHALHQSGIADVYDLRTHGGSIVDGAAWAFDLVSRNPELDTDLYRKTRHPGGRTMGWPELFVREFPNHPATPGMKAWLRSSSTARFHYLAGGPTTCLYRSTARE